MKKTSISSVVCFDIIDFSKKSEAEQQAVKKQFSALVDLAVVDIPQKDRMIVDTAHGAIITCSGPLESALEDALFIALTVRDEVLNSNSVSDSPLYLLIGINLGSVKVDKSANVNEAPNITGDGLVEAQRIMSFANPNQILVSRAYYDMASKLTLEIAQMFEKYDMHAYEHDIYAVRLLSEKATVDGSAAIAENAELLEEAPTKSASNWGIYILPILLTIAMLFAFSKWMNEEKGKGVTEQPVTVDAAIEEPTTLDVDPAEQESTQVDVAEDEVPEAKEAQTSTTKQQSTKKKATKKKVSTQQAKPSTSNTNKPADSAEDGGSTPQQVAEPTNKQDEKSGWDSFKESIKQGSDVECTQAQRAMNQCN